MHNEQSFLRHLFQCFIISFEMLHWGKVQLANKAQVAICWTTFFMAEQWGSLHGIKGSPACVRILSLYYIYWRAIGI